MIVMEAPQVSPRHSFLDEHRPTNSPLYLAVPKGTTQFPFDEERHKALWPRVNLQGSSSIDTFEKRVHNLHKMLIFA